MRTLPHITAETLRPGASTVGRSPGADEADQKGKKMGELFKKEIREAGTKLQRKGYYVANMTGCHNDKFEIYNRACDVVMDYLTVNQLVQLSNLL